MRIIYFDLDCVRVDHLGIYGYQRETSPVIDAIAQEALVFDNCFVSDAPCLPSRAALFSCRPGIANGVISHEWPGYNFRFPARGGMPSYYDEYTMPMRLLQQHNYHTVTFSIFAQRHLAWWFNAGFSEVLNPTRPSYHENSQSENPRVLTWIKHHIHDHDDLFLHIHYWDAHTPYHPDDTCRERVALHPLPDFPDEDTIRDHYANFYGPKSARDIMIRSKPDYTSSTPYMPDEIANCDDFKVMLDSYDGSIASADQAIGEIIQALKDAGVYDDCVIIISADHGEAIGQMGMYFEHGVAVDGVAHVPLIMRWPGLTDAGGRCETLMYQYDFMATLMDLLGIEPPPLWDAQSLAPVFHGEPSAGRPFLVYGCGIFALQRAVRTRDHAFVRTFHPGCSPLDDVYLFDVQSDPHQTLNIVDDHPQLRAEMERLYADWWHGWCTGPDAVIDPVHIQTPTFSYFPVQDMEQRLEYVGRADQLVDLRARHKRTRRPHPQSTIANSNL